MLGQFFGGNPAPVQVLPVFTGATLAEAPKGNPYQMRRWHKARRAYLKSLKPTTFSGGTYWVDFAQGSDSNDGLDGLGFNLSGIVAWNHNTLTLTSPATFGSYYANAKLGVDQIYIKAGTNVVAGLYTVMGATANTLTLDRDITSNGSDPNNVTSSTGPWQTPGKLISASVLTTNNCRVRFAQGSDRIYRMTGTVSTTLGGDRTWLPISGTNHVWDTYYPTNRTPTGSVSPRITRFVSQGSVTWTNTVPGTRQTIALTATTVAAFREIGDNRQAYTLVTSTTNVENIPGSFFFAANTLHVHFPWNWVPGAGAYTQFEYIKDQAANTTADFTCIGIASGVGYCWIEGLSIDGFGVCSDNGTPQPSYGIHSYGSGSDCVVVKGCTCTYNGKHCIGSTSAGSGGILLCEDCIAGWTMNDTPYVAFSATGGQEFYGYNNRTCGARIPWGNTPFPVNMGAGGGVNAFYSHCNSSYVYKAAMVVNERMTNDPGQYECNGLGGSDYGVVFTANEKLCNVYILDCTHNVRNRTVLDGYGTGLLGTDAQGKTTPSIMQGAANDGATPNGWSTWYDGCTVYASCLWGDTNQYATCGTQLCGLATNSTFIVDGTQIQGDAGGPWNAVGLFYDLGALCNVQLQNCHIRIMVGTGRWAGVCSKVVNADSVNNVPGSGTETASRLIMNDCIVTFEGNSLGWYLGCNSSTVTNLVCNANNPSSPTYRGFTYNGAAMPGMLIQRDWQVGRVPKVGEIDATPVALPSGAYLGYDAKGNPRRSGTSAMGPLEAV